MKPSEFVIREHVAARRVHRGRLFRKYFLLILMLVCGTLVISGGIGLYFAYQENKVALASLQREKAGAAAARIEEFVRQVEQQLAFAALPHLGAEGIEQRNLEFQKVLRIAQAVTDIAYMDEHGREQLVVSRLQMNVIGSGKDRSQEPAFKEARPGQTWFGPVYFRKDTEPYITMAIRSKQAGPVTAADVNLKFIWDVVTRIKIGQKGKAYVVDATGHLVADPDIGLVLRKTNLSHLEQVRKALAPDADDAVAMLAKDFGGNSVLTAHAPIEPAREQRAQGTDAGGLGWKVFVEQPVSEVFAALDATILRTIALLLAGLLFSALAALSLARSMVRPISTLQEGAARIGAGDLDQKIEVHTGDELETLADQFNEMSAQLRESYAGLEKKVEERTQELQEALEQQTATSEILKVISSSTTNTQPVFEAIVQSGLKLFPHAAVMVGLPDGAHIRLGAIATADSAQAEGIRLRFPIPLTREYMHATAILDRRLIDVPDAERSEEAALAPGIRNFIASGSRAITIMPMLRGDAAIGTISVTRRTAGPLSQKQIALLRTFADQAVIAIENVRLFNETKEALERQTATADVLRVISGSPTDVQPVFEAILEKAIWLCDAHLGGLFLQQPDGAWSMASYRGDDPSVQEAFQRVEAGPHTGFGKLVRLRRPVHIPDLLADSDTAKRDPLRVMTIEVLKARTFFAVPLLKEGAVIGAVVIYRREVRPFSEAQIRLVTTFADQAVIAIENVRLFNETKEALEQQTATSDILQVTSKSPTDVKPVFDTILANTLRLCEGSTAVLWTFDGQKLRIGAHRNMTEGAVRHLTENPLEPGDWNPTAQAALERRTIHVLDVFAEPRYRPLVPSGTTNTRPNAGTVLAVPLMRYDELVGVITVWRYERKLFSEKQLAMVNTFAAQAVIAIGNVKLFNETKEALEQQTATAEILKVISSSTTDTQPVFEAIVRSGLNLFPDAAVAVSLPDGDQIRLAAIAAGDAAQAANMRARYPFPLTRDYMQGAAILDRRLVDVPDAERHQDGAMALGVRNFLASGSRAMTVMPMLRGSSAIGTIAVVRRVAGPLSEKQLALLRTFADQAVIAIENVRLFNETKESLEQQTAISEILRVISSSPSDVQPVLEAVAERAARICDAQIADIVLAERGVLRPAAVIGSLGRPSETPLDRSTVMGRSVVDKTTIHVADLQSEGEEYPTGQKLAVKYGHRTILAVPLLRERRALGTILLRRAEVRPFEDKHIALLKTFADQAAIAIENVRLFNETKEALERQTATAEVLNVISGSITDAKPVFDVISRSVLKLYGARHVALYVRVGDKIDRVGYAVSDKSADDGSQALWPIPLDDKSLTGRAILGGDLVHIQDTETEPGLSEQSRAIIRKTGVRSVLLAPMQSMGVTTGTLSVARRAAGGFTEREVELLRTFADQAVIAMENVRLFREIQEKSAQLEVANKHKSDFLANMSHELRTPLNAIIGFSEVLIERMFGEVNEKQADYLKDIHESGKHLLSLINDILDLSKIEAGRMDLEISRFDLPSALSNAMTLVRERAQRHGIVLGLEVDPRLGEFEADERKVKQILVNLLSNAVKFTPDGGRVDVSAKLDTDKVEIAVKDTGIGIAPEDHAAVFEEFKQVGRDYTRKAEGTGLGLALTKRFVELHGGAIRLQSTPGKGSTFTITLPLTH